MNGTKFIMLMGESWNLKAFLSLISDDFKWDYVAPSSLLLLHAYNDSTVEVSYNDNAVRLKGACSNLESCSAKNFFTLLAQSGTFMNSEVKTACGADFFLRRN